VNTPAPGTEPGNAHALGDGGRRRRDGILGILSSAPLKRWPDAFIHHGARAGLLVLLAVAVSLFFPPTPGIQVGRYEVGMVASEDVLASIPFEIPKSAQELERERIGAAASVPATFQGVPEAAQGMASNLERFFDAVQAAAQAENADATLDRLLEQQGLSLSPSQRRRLLDGPTRNQVAAAARNAALGILPRGVVDDPARLEALSGRVLIMEADGRERFLPRDSVRTPREFFEGAATYLPSGAPSEVEEVLRLVLIRFFDASLRYDEFSTERERDAARRAVSTIRGTVLQGEAVVRAAQQLGESEVERLRAYEEALRARGRVDDRGLQLLPLLGGIGLNLILLGVFGAFLYLYRGDIYGNFRWVLLQSLLIFTFAGVAGLLARNGLAPELLPVAFVTLTMAVLWDGRIALVMAGCLAVLMGAQVPFQSVHAWLPAFIGGGAAALSVRAVRRRSQTWIFIALIVAAYAGLILTLGLVSGREPGRIFTSVAWATGNAMISAILAMGFLPVFEWFTRITTDQTLLEWADPNRPLLKRLSLEAPGTYAHTINVANLAEAAANAIGANGLLCRVGVYYHDVGKMLKAQFFIENQPGGARNPHDMLDPVTSAAIVREHVTEGIRLGREAKLPDVLMDFIPEHHGTQEISYFAMKAREQGITLDPEVFRYPGPRPRSRETAIVMLADSVESATRTLQDATPERLRDLIAKIVDDKIEAGQLDETPLTLGEVGAIRASFEKVLGGVYHHRIEYPQTRHLTQAPAVDTPAVAQPIDAPAAEKAPQPAKTSSGSAHADAPPSLFEADPENEPKG
jgi:putative nucleotidyltransferase with HDIG domain